MPSRARFDVSTTGRAWTLANVLSFATLLGFTAATWGLFQRTSWWEMAAVASAAVGIAAVAPYWLAAERAGETSPAFNAVIHLIGSLAVFALLLVPALERWVDSHVMT